MLQIAIVRHRVYMNLNKYSVRYYASLRRYIRIISCRRTRCVRDFVLDASLRPVTRRRYYRRW